MSSRPRLRPGRIASVALVVGCVSACVLAEPVSDLPRPAQQRPTIIRESAVPSPSVVLGTFPDKFIVPVELSDPTVTFQWAAFVDFSPDNPSSLQNVQDSVFEAASLSGRTRVLEIAIPTPTASDRCHVIEVVVALQLESTTSATQAHTPRLGGPGGDSITWFYSPGGDLAGCPSLVVDAGTDGDAAGGIP